MLKVKSDINYRIRFEGVTSAKVRRKTSITSKRTVSDLRSFNLHTAALRGLPVSMLVLKFWMVQVVR